MRIRSWSMVLAPLFLAIVAFVSVVALAQDAQRPWLVPVAAAGLAAWTIFMLRVSVRGTPIPFGGLAGDTGRLTAAATRFASSPANADAWIPGLYIEYPPLFPWLIGRTAALLDIPAWRMVADFQIVFVSLAVLVAFLLWQRLVPAWVAFAITVVTLVPIEVPAQVVRDADARHLWAVWVLATFTRPPKGRWHWLPSGLLAGLMVIMYYGWMIWGGLGIVALAVWMWRTEPDRMAYLRYVAKVVAVALVVASWYVVPYVWSLITKPGAWVPFGMSTQARR